MHVVPELHLSSANIVRCTRHGCLISQEILEDPQSFSLERKITDRAPDCPQARVAPLQGPGGSEMKYIGCQLPMTRQKMGKEGGGRLFL